MVGIVARVKKKPEEVVVGDVTRDKNRRSRRGVDGS